MGNVWGDVMQTDYVRYFIDVAKHGSIKVAAERYFMSPQGVSRAIAALETDIGSPLFKRGNNCVVLTAAGTEFLASAERIIAAEDQAKSLLANICKKEMDTENQVFRAYCSSIVFDTPLFYPIADASRGIFGKVRFSQNSNQEVADLLLAAVDEEDTAAISFGILGVFDLFPEDNAAMIKRLRQAGYEYLPILKCEDLVLVPQDSPLAHKTVLSQMDVLSMPLAISQGDMARAVRKKFGDAGIFLSTFDSTFRAKLVRSGECLAFAPALAMSYGVPDGVVAVPMEEPYSVEVGFVARSEVLGSQLVREIIRRLASRYSGQEASSNAVELFVSSASNASEREAKIYSRKDFMRNFVNRFNLSQREIDVLELLAENKSIAACAVSLNVSVPTLRSHIQHIYHKCGVHSREELMSLVYAGVM